jgi:hypothetical protein
LYRLWHFDDESQNQWEDVLELAFMMLMMMLLAGGTMDERSY